MTNDLQMYQQLIYVARAAANSEHHSNRNGLYGKLLEKLFPKLENKISGLALKVPVPNGSLVDMTIFTEKEVSVTAINEVIRTGASAPISAIMVSIRKIRLFRAMLR